MGRDSRTSQAWMILMPPPAAWTNSTRHTSERFQKGSDNMGELDLSPKSTSCLTAWNHHHLDYQSIPSPLPTPLFTPSTSSQCPTVLPSVPVFPTPILPKSPSVHAQQQHHHQSHVCIMVALWIVIWGSTAALPVPPDVVSLLAPHVDHFVHRCILK